jgi:hypothetical protein
MSQQPVIYWLSITCGIWDSFVMASLMNKIDRILRSGERLTAVEVTLRLNAELSYSNSYTISEVVRCLETMPNLAKSGKEYSYVPSGDTLVE